MAYNPLISEHRRNLASAILKVMTEAGFTEEFSANPKTIERHFSRAVEVNNQPTKIKVQVWTSIVGTEVRQVDKDAIRVSAVYCSQNKEQGIIKAIRVYRTGTIEDICQRLLGRMREVYSKAKHMEKCHRCNAPLFTSSKSNLVCAEFCWTKQGG